MPAHISARASLVAVACLSLPAAAQTTAELIAQEEAEKLQTCLDLIETDTEAAYEFGLKWLGDGSRPPARYCTAQALIARGHYDEGAYRLEALAKAPEVADPQQQFVYLAQAGSAWLAAELPEQAIVAINEALKFSDRNPGLLVDRAAANMMLENYKDAIGDLNVAIESEPDYPEALFMRARAFLMTDRLTPALADIEAARELDPTNVDMVVLRGEIREAIRLKAEGRD